VYAMAVNDVAELQQRVNDGCELIHNTAGIFERVRHSLMRRAARWKHKDNTLGIFSNLFLSKQ
jgi:hypothetical protein